MTERLLTMKTGGPNRTLPDGVVPPEGTWVQTTAQHLAHWAVYLSRSTDAARGTTPVDLRALFERALRVSPLNPTARLAVGQLDRQQGGTAVTIGQLGQSRDVVSLASTASWLLSAGKKDAALRMYKRALEVASHRELSRFGPPRFSDDPAAPRYWLPGEEAVRDVVAALVKETEWPFSEWSAILPKDTSLPLVAARFLREQGKPEAEQLLELYLSQDQPRGPSGAGEAVLAAARAESHALLSHWKEAEDGYRQAIELVDDDTIKRSWWFSLADIALHLDDEGQRQAALRSALAAATSDDITKRATEKERSAGPRARLRSTGTKAN
jgi:tetratricopeptide (TPR) repeat protein